MSVPGYDVDASTARDSYTCVVPQRPTTRRSVFVLLVKQEDVRVF
jgi:hypothetical protein